jgi:hypothetical protein
MRFAWRTAAWVPLPPAAGEALGNHAPVEQHLQRVDQGMVHHAVRERSRGDGAPLGVVDLELDWHARAPGVAVEGALQ